MIIYINQGSRTLSIRIANRSTGDIAASWEDIQLLVKPGPAHGCDCWEGGSPWVFNGCWPGHRTGVDIANPWKRENIPTMVFAAESFSDDGHLVFTLDDRLDQVPPGRYTGIVQRTPIQDVKYDPYTLLHIPDAPPEKVVIPKGFDFPACSVDIPPAEPPEPPKEACVLAVFDIDLGPSCGDHFIDQVILEPALGTCGEKDG